MSDVKNAFLKYVSKRLEEVVIENTGDLDENRKEVNPKMVPEDVDTDSAIDMCAKAILKRAAGSYGHAIYEKIMGSVREDVKNSQAYWDCGAFTQKDVQNAIGRALCNLMKIGV